MSDTAKTTETTKTNSDRVKKIAGELKTGLTTTDKKKYTGGDDVYVNNLPEGLTAEQVKLKEEYDHDFCAAGVLALGELSAEAAKTDATVESTELVVKTLGKSRMHATWKHTSEGNVGGKPWKKYGSTSVGITTSSDAKTGQIGTAMEEIATLTQQAATAAK